MWVGYEIFLKNSYKKEYAKHPPPHDYVKFWKLIHITVSMD